MTYQRVIKRNRLEGHYESGGLELRPAIAGDLRRFEIDTRDDWHVQDLATRSGATPEQVKLILDMVLGPEAYGPWGEPVEDYRASWTHNAAEGGRPT